MSANNPSFGPAPVPTAPPSPDSIAPWCVSAASNINWLRQRSPFVSGVPYAGTGMSSSNAVQGIMKPNNFGGPLIIFDEAGNQLPTDGTTTCGIQEALNYAIPLGFPVRLYGQGWKSDTITANASAGATSISVSNPGRWLAGDSLLIVQNTGTTSVAISAVNGSTITFAPALGGAANSGNRIYSLGALLATTTITVPPCQMAHIELVNLQLNFGTGIGSGAGFKFDSCSLIKFDASNSNVIYGGTGACYDVAPTNPNPIDGNIIIEGQFDFGWLALQGGAGGAVGIKFDIAGGTINRSSFRCAQLNAFGSAGAYGVLMDGSQSSGSSAFEDNNLEIFIDGEFSAAAFSEGTTTTNAGLYLRNFYNIIANQKSSAEAIHAYGAADVWNARVPAEVSTYTKAMVLDTSATGHQGFLNYAGGTSAPVFDDRGTGNVLLVNGASPQNQVLGATVSWTNTATPSTIFTVPLAVGTYLIRAHLSTVCGAAGGLAVFAVASLGLAVTSVSAQGFAWNGTTAVQNNTVTALGLGTPIINASAVVTDVYLDIGITISSPKTLLIQGSQNIANATTSSVKLNSTLQVLRVA